MVILILGAVTPNLLLLSKLSSSHLARCKFSSQYVFIMNVDKKLEREREREREREKKKRELSYILLLLLQNQHIHTLSYLPPSSFSISPFPPNAFLPFPSLPPTPKERGDPPVRGESDGNRGESASCILFLIIVCTYNVFLVWLGRA